MLTKERIQEGQTNSQFTSHALFPSADSKKVREQVFLRLIGLFRIGFARKRNYRETRNFRESEL
jgi:hypothetical protein